MQQVYLNIHIFIRITEHTAMLLFILEKILISKKYIKPT